jgi:hypothetical protein
LVRSLRIISACRDKLACNLAIFSFLSTFIHIYLD